LYAGSFDLPRRAPITHDDGTGCHHVKAGSRAMRAGAVKTAHHAANGADHAPPRGLSELGTTQGAQLLQIPCHARGDARHVGDLAAAESECVLRAGHLLFGCSGYLGRAPNCRDDSSDSNHGEEGGSRFCHDALTMVENGRSPAHGLVSSPVVTWPRLEQDLHASRERGAVPKLAEGLLHELAAGGTPLLRNIAGKLAAAPRGRIDDGGAA